MEKTFEERQKGIIEKINSWIAYYDQRKKGLELMREVALAAQDQGRLDQIEAMVR